MVSVHIFKDEKVNKQDEDIFIEGAKRIKQLIQDKNIKPMDIVNALEVSRGTVSKWLQGSSTPNTQSLIDLARYLGVSEHWILEGKESKANETQHSNFIDLKQASVDQLIAELKARYAVLNLKAEIKVSVQPIEGGFVTQD